MRRWHSTEFLLEQTIFERLSGENTHEKGNYKDPIE
jgi:hypothetical protein